MEQLLIQQGAEAKIFLDKKDNLIIKERIKKEYRIKEIDEKIRKKRTKAERKLLIKASNIIDCPNPKIDDDEYRIIMPFIEGKKLSENLEKFDIRKQKIIMKKLGEEVSKIHKSNIIHGDLTTSNLIFNDKDNKLSIIDFGLGFISQRIEDKAVDLHLLKQSLKTRHPLNYDILFKEFLKGYKKNKDYNEILKRVEIIEKRGRYKN